MVKDSSFLSGRLCVVFVIVSSNYSMVSSVASRRRSYDPVSGPLLVQQLVIVWTGVVLGFMVF